MTEQSAVPPRAVRAPFRTVAVVGSLWDIVIPVKRFASAKSRLADSHPPSARIRLARAFALDTIRAARLARSVRRVVVVTDESTLAADLAAWRQVDVVGEGGTLGLTRAVARGLEHVHAAGGRFGDPAAGTAVLLGDLPALRPRDLDLALSAAAAHRLAFVPDADETGTTLATALAGAEQPTRFGAHSAARHAAAGFVDLAVRHTAAVAPGLRRDVDTAADLHTVERLGVGARTAEALRLIAPASTTAGDRPSFTPPTALQSAARKEAS